MDAATATGIAHFIAESGALGQGLLAVLALTSVVTWTIVATAPFVGLFGTVRGVYHALLAIGLNGAGTLDQVAGPVGEALIMTGLGLAVAIPAVMGYNALTRGNRVLLSRLEAFARELHTFVSTGQPLSAGAEPPPAAATVRALPSRPATA